MDKEKLDSWRADMIRDLVKEMKFDKWELGFLVGLIQGEIDFYREDSGGGNAK